MTGRNNQQCISHKHAPPFPNPSIKLLRSKLDVFPSGKCVVHQVFNSSVVETVKSAYPDAYMSAHLEVPGEMFEVAMSASLENKGVVGSTADILNFITEKVEEKATEAKAGKCKGKGKERLQFILGTEAGMVTSIVKNVQKILSSTGAGSHVEAEIVFPVAKEAVMVDGEGGIVPGASGDEGCGTGGGCATCPFMKMNDLDALLDLAEMVGDKETMTDLTGYHPPNRLEGKTWGGESAVELGIKPILHMRHLTREKKFDPELVIEVTNFHNKRQTM